MRIHPTAAAGFAPADAYEAARPSYPAEAVALIAERLALGPGKTVLDLAAGTGKLTRLLVPTGARVVAVEPLAAMRERLEALVPAAEALEGAAEAIPLADASVDGVTVAQAFHWFRFDEAFRELHRVLRPGGGLVLVWNGHLPDPLQKAIQEVVDSFRKGAPTYSEAWREAFAKTRLFGPAEQTSFRRVTPTHVEALVAYYLSISVIAALPPERRAEVAERIRELAGGAGDPCRFR